MQGQQDSPWQGKSWHGAAPFRKVHPCSSPGLVLWHQEPTSRNSWLPGKASAACMSSLLRSLSSPAELPLPFPSTLGGAGTAGSAPAQHGHGLPALLAPLALLAQAG